MAWRTYGQQDPSTLGELELLSLLLGSDGPALAGALLGRFGSVGRMATAEVDDLMAVPGLGPRRAARVHAALQLGRRARRVPEDKAPVGDVAGALRWLRPGLVGLAHEELHALYLDRRRRPLAVRTLTRGSDRFTVVDPRQIFRPAVAVAASAVILAHNHPSGDPTPSAQDQEVTRRVAAAGHMLGVELVDHLVIGEPGHRSMREAGCLGAWEPVAAAWTAEDVADRGPDRYPPPVGGRRDVSRAAHGPADRLLDRRDDRQGG